MALPVLVVPIISRFVDLDVELPVIGISAKIALFFGLAGLLLGGVIWVSPYLMEFEASGEPAACPGCGYDLRESKESCPECGRVIPPAMT